VIRDALDKEIDIPAKSRLFLGFDACRGGPCGPRGTL